LINPTVRHSHTQTLHFNALILTLKRKKLQLIMHRSLWGKMY